MTSDTQKDELELIQRISGGERELFHQLVRPYETKIYMAVLAMLGNEAEAEDASQDVMVKAFRHLHSFRGDAKFGTWLISIALNEARGRLRKAKRVNLISLDEEREGQESDFTPAMLTDWREIPSDTLERAELRATLQSALEGLPPIYREVFTLRDLEELNVEETARALGVTENLVKVRLHRARMLLQKKLAPLLKSTFSPQRRGIFRRALWS